MAELKPARVFEQFAKINHIPRPSKHEEQMIAFLKKFGEDHGLETLVDETGNVLIRKPATKGYENRPTTILQSHMDMVCDKLVDVDFDFHKDAIQTYVDGEWLHAKGTTLGADDGIGDAIELAILDSDDIEHGPLECVFTVDEETSLGGAIGMTLETCMKVWSKYHGNDIAGFAAYCKKTRPDIVSKAESAGQKFTDYARNMLDVWAGIANKIEADAAAVDEEDLPF